ncbi:NAD-dependent SIR2 family protein deacetylase [Antricoccus suffuscus]|uniref:protein acetyllysine N-acetyltransferase n=1 Tax=Antricoccus suffuscus TaxID=1629062 RepID=A0A2T0ZY91_9ACTN|nr:Sir2 family NAD-dependent protein deacetylase [Antricoccus suffuscus]PRZ41321.1 NAD-dependent SIR2 family protein deacetylase [Antricoccus suffuscus]
MPTAPSDLRHALADLVATRGVVTLTGAGMSTDSGIPDYRGPDAVPRTQMTFQEFAASETARQRYWARSYVGFAKFRRADPNAGHVALAKLQTFGFVDAVITQNVDGLHEDAGSSPVIDLHGRISEVICLNCGTVSSREFLQSRFTAANPGFLEQYDGAAAPDADADIEDTDSFYTQPCLICGGVLKPNVVLFGENVAKPKVEHCRDLVEAATGLLVLGSSLHVQSGLRFVRWASRSGIPVAIVNRGATRGDEFADVRIESGCSETLAVLITDLQIPQVS